jgi:hypothetical protein
MLVIVRYGDNREMLVNSWCKIYVFFDHVRKLADLDYDVELELCDSKADIMRLADQKYLFANNILREKEKYILLKVESMLYKIHELVI